MDPVAIRDPVKRQYNVDFKKARVTVEHVIGRLKKKWPVLLKGLRFWDMAKCSRAIEVYVALYNFILKEEGDYDGYDDDDEDSIPPPTAHLQSAKKQTCDKILDKYYKKIK